MDAYKLFNWGLRILSFGLLIYLGFLLSKYMSKSDEGGFLVAGRSLGAFVAAGTIVATGFSGWGFMGSPGVTYQFGAEPVARRRACHLHLVQLRPCTLMSQH